MEPAGNAILSRMLDRLFASLINGPGLNCRPHNSRQRIDLVQLDKLCAQPLTDAPSAAFFRSLLMTRTAKLAAAVDPPRRRFRRNGDRSNESRPPDESSSPPQEMSPAEKIAAKAYSEQQAVLQKFRGIVEDARTYEQDTGVHILELGFPLLSLPPGSFGSRRAGARRILAPIAFVPVSLSVKAGLAPAVEIACRGEGVDLVLPNLALFTWLEQQTGQSSFDQLDEDQDADLWFQLSYLVKHVGKLVRAAVPEIFAQSTPESLVLQPAPRSDEEETKPFIVTGAIVGLFPVANQGLLRDTQAMVAGEPHTGPTESFLNVATALEPQPQAHLPGANVDRATPARRTRQLSEERLITHADPCQAAVVRHARTARGLVVHGPPGTGKSQTIANIIGDHLARGQRALLVCDKRTALDVVANRLNHLGLGHLCALVHDPQRDQRDLYRRVREQLDELASARTDPHAAAQIDKADAELQRLHAELTSYRSSLISQEHEGNVSFHDLMAEWLSLPIDDTSGPVCGVESITIPMLDGVVQDLRDIFERAATVQYEQNPWRDAQAIPLSRFLATPMDSYRRIVDGIVAIAKEADRTIDPALPPFEPARDLAAQEQMYRSVGIAAAQAIESAAPPFLQRWLSAPSTATPRKDLALRKEDVARVHAGPLDAGLFNLVRPRLADQHGLMGEVARDMAALQAYLGGYHSSRERFNFVLRLAPGTPLPVITFWLNSGDAALARARRSLEDVNPIAKTIEQEPLNRSLRMANNEQPASFAALNAHLADLGSYLEIAGKWTRIFYRKRKQAVAPLAAKFGLTANAASALELQTFYRGIKLRMELRAALEQDVLGAAIANQPDDTELLTVHRQHLAAVSAVLALRAQVPTPSATAHWKAGEPDSAILSDAIHQTISADFQSAAAIMKRYELSTNFETVAALLDFLQSLAARIRLLPLYHSFSPASPTPVWVEDAELLDVLDAGDATFALCELLENAPKPFADAVRAALVQPAAAGTLITALQNTAPRATVLRILEAALAGAGIFSDPFIAAASSKARSNAPIASMWLELRDQLHTVEHILRIHTALQQLPQALADSITTLLGSRVEPDVGLAVLRKAVLANEIRQRLESFPLLQSLDAQRLKTSFERYRQLDAQKKVMVRNSIIHLWLQRQREKLLVATGSRVNSAGADLRRRLTTRGEHAMRLRQVIAAGLGDAAAGGDPNKPAPISDPLFDLRPVWMASPETVAQLFPRMPLFDVVIFDEASQCRLEEAIPILTRGHRVVIAGDPKQLPPTRFFESAIATSDDAEVEGEQDLFEKQQSEIEDLLGAALNLEIQECYLDVHYRSRNADLIEFSNEQFYGSRLQAIPGHPNNRTRYSPVTLYRADGTYEDRQNPTEADTVVKIVRDLLRRAAPPSIGIACFNLQQRDLIIDKLDELAATDHEFAAALGIARSRQGQGSFEGLFVKNLENVQGDERDHMIISTTYGPDPQGVFYRRFGPLTRAGGGRRLNVLITRAREEVHLVTSIPPLVYRSLPPVPPDKTPTGSYLLFSYIHYAEKLAALYEIAHQQLQKRIAVPEPTVRIRDSRSPSKFAQSLAGKLAGSRATGSQVHWGNDGFCVDVALDHPVRPDDVTVGVLCDASRFLYAEDPVEWDIFATNILESQGWKLHRIWTPHFFRDPSGHVDAILRSAQEVVNREEPDAIRVGAQE